MTPRPPTPANAAPDLASDAARFTLLLGRALHIYGTPATRLEAVVTKLASELGFGVEVFALPTSLFVSFDVPGEEGRAHLFRMHRSEEDFDKLARLDALWNGVADGRMSPREGIAEIHRIDEAPPLYGKLATCVAFAAVSAGGVVLYGGGVESMGVGAACGLVLSLFLIAAAGRARLVGLVELIGAALVAVVATLGVHVGGVGDPDVVALAGIIVLLPGFMLTTAISELAERNVVSGTARLAYSGLVTLMLGFGVLAGRAAGEEFVGRVEAAASATSAPAWLTFLAVAVAGVMIGVIFQAQRRDLLPIAFAVLAPFAVLRAGADRLGPELGAFVGALLAGVISNVYARTVDRPATITRIPGILVLVPGSLGFLSITELMRGDAVAGVERTVATLTTAFALVVGLLASNAIVSPRKAL